MQSMASVQTLLSESRWHGVNLASLIRAELAPYATATNTKLDGPAVYLTPDATHPVIRDLLSYELGGKVDLASARQGVRCRIELPAWWILAALT